MQSKGIYDPVKTVPISSDDINLRDLKKAIIIVCNPSCEQESESGLLPGRFSQTRNLFLASGAAEIHRKLEKVT